MARKPILPTHEKRPARTPAFRFFLRMNTWQSSLSKRPSLFPTIAGLFSLLFILLINIMISDSIVFWPGISVESSLTTPPILNPDREIAPKFIVTVTDDESCFFFNNKQLDWDGLTRELSLRKQEIQNSSEMLTGKDIPPKIILRATSTTPYSVITRITDLCRGLGMNVYLTAEKLAPQEPNSGL